jgi:hypothetical protein
MWDRAAIESLIMIWGIVDSGANTRDYIFVDSVVGQFEITQSRIGA